MTPTNMKKGWMKPLVLKGIVLSSHWKARIHLLKTSIPASILPQKKQVTLANPKLKLS